MTMRRDRQATIARTVGLSGPGLHTGRRSAVRLIPAPADHGRVFRVRDRHGVAQVAVGWTARVPSRLSTSLSLGEGRKVRTIEHLLAALAAFEIDNVLIEVDGQEIPILDGSARPWCDRLLEAGIALQDAARRFVRIRRPVQIERDGGFIRGEPHEGLHLDVSFDNLSGFGLMRWAGEMSPGTFIEELSRSRSFGRPPWPRSRRAQIPVPQAGEPNRPRPDLADALPAAFWEGLARDKARHEAGEPVLRGAWPGRVAIVIGKRILGGARYPDEPVRHVALDLLGDLALAGAPILGRITAHVPSHEKSFAFVAALMSDPEAWDAASCCHAA